MLQIVTTRYFRDGVPLHSTVHQRVLYTNRLFLRAGTVELPVGALAPSTNIAPISTAALLVTEHLEAEGRDGRPSVVVATGGTELINDLADVLSFALNSVFSPDHDLVRQLVPNSLGRPSTDVSHLRTEFQVAVTKEDIEAELGAITKTGSGHARRLLVEAAWHYPKRPAIDRTLHDR